MASQQPPEEAVNDLPVGAVSMAALRIVTGNMASLVRMALFPLLLSSLIVALLIPASSSAFLSTLLQVASYVPHTLFAVAWHRKTLLHLQEDESTSITAWNRTHWQFLIRTVILFAILYLLVLIGSLPVGILFGNIPALLPFGFIGLIVAALYVLARLSFILPAAAVGENYSMNNSWKHTKAQAWRLVGSFLLLVIPSGVVIIMVATIMLPMLFPDLFAGFETAAQAGAPATGEEVLIQLSAEIRNNPLSFVFFQIVIIALSYLPTAAVISMLSLAFQTCTGWVPETASAPSPAPTDETDFTA
ncbi:hypothetical protein O4H49_11410 [Kiloniella laminariae]|uniref:Glycerophosphoryl diester phosphodiesterase membrane domain-containing protein n=1 Tax=Kiloniella laminariae TaxID=454162 RepID=A0ABT4LJW0_9PROT|nr:hypothetical protein [Kiloniella laminariae]MCZ4281389.1 hypothetical protein [Kiloniella laminariae]